MPKFILYYSTQCRHCNNILKLIGNSNELNSTIEKIEITNNISNIPNYIKSVPSLLIVENNNGDLLVGKNLFNWIESQLNNSQTQTQNANKDKNIKEEIKNNNNSILDYDPCTMNGFSDNFSFLDSNKKTIDYNFSFLNDNNSINIDENQFSKDKNNDSSKKTDMEQAYEKFIENRDLEIPKGRERK